MPLPELLPITPFTRPVRGEVIVPGSKSLTNRALLLAALGTTPVTLTGALFSEDTRLMADALRRLGFTVTADEAALTVRVADQARAFPADAAPVELFVGLAGTAARFLTALCAAAPRGVYRLDGVPQMRKRPMRALIEALRSLGADIRFVTPDARMSVMEIKWGLVPDMAGVLLMRGLARDDVIRELTFSGRIFDGVEAQLLGFATRVCADPREQALALAHEIAGRNPDALRAGKRLLSLPAATSAAAVLQAESDEQIKLMGSPNQVEAVAAALQKRAPEFRDSV
jgi:hypothetical protein